MIVLKIGASGPEVEQLQRDLTAAGFPLEVDGDFGAKTKDAVIAFARASMGIISDGAATIELQTALAAKLAKLKAPAATPVSPYLVPPASDWRGTVGRGFTPPDFAAYVGALRFAAWRPQFVVLHNTGAPRLDQWHINKGQPISGEARMRGLTNYYRNEQGWLAGPHLFVADDLIWVFTPLTSQGTHSPSWNSISWGVEMVGDFSTEAFDPRVRDNAVSALATLHAWRGISPATLRLHKEDPRTTHDCPGKHVVKGDMIARIEARLQQDAGEHDPARTV